MCWSVGGRWVVEWLARWLAKPGLDPGSDSPLMSSPLAKACASRAFIVPGWVVECGKWLYGGDVWWWSWWWCVVVVVPRGQFGAKGQHRGLPRGQSGAKGQHRGLPRGQSGAKGQHGYWQRSPTQGLSTVSVAKTKQPNALSQTT